MRGNAGKIHSFTNPIVVHDTVSLSHFISVPAEVPAPSRLLLPPFQSGLRYQTLSLPLSLSQPKSSDPGKESLASLRGVFA